MEILAYVLSGITLLLGSTFYVQQKVPGAAPPLGLAAKLIAGALSPVWTLLGAAGAVIGWAYQSYLALALGIAGSSMMIWYIWQSTRDHDGFEKAFGAGWLDIISPDQAEKMLQRRWNLFSRKISPEPIWDRNVVYRTISGSDRDLLCDIWRPSNNDVSGLGMVYFHGGSWTAMDKDFGTRALFRHLAEQGHTIMDVSYRLCPEVDFYGMMEDVYHAIAWMKENATEYGVDTGKIVIAGGSTGGHIAMLAGYAQNHPELTPHDLLEKDLSVCGILTFYAPTDLVYGCSYWNVKQRWEKLPKISIGDELDASMAFQYGGLTNLFLGGYPEEIPEVYHLASPTSHVHPGSPPTLMIQADKDVLVPLETTLAHHSKLVESGVPAINVVLPGSEHAFDLLLPQISPPAQSALYDVDRFLAVLVNKGCTK